MFGKKSFSFLDDEWWIWWPSGKIFRQLLEATFYVSGQSFWGIAISLKNYFSESIWNLNGEMLAFGDILQHGRHDCTLHLQRVILKSVYRFLSLTLFLICTFWAIKFQKLRGIFRQGPKNCSLHVRTKLLRNYVFLQKKSSSIFFRHNWKTLDVMG